VRMEWVEGENYWRGAFSAMGGPCQILIDSHDEGLAKTLYKLVQAETQRIEGKYSRYRADSALSKLNRSHGRPVTVDAETAQLLDYAEQCYRLSDGKFDISSGVLRRVWRFDGSDRLPDADAVAALLQNVGWDKLQWRKPVLILPQDMELDLGGIGKEYAVDRCAQLCRQTSDVSLLINYGGDIFISGPRRGDQSWIIGIDDPHAAGGPSAGALRIFKGGVATSGDARRFLLKDGVRYGHILDPHTGWPVRDAPRSVTVVAQSCVEAGMLASFAMLQGSHAEHFLQEQRVVHRCIW
jgi:thiamine biosynthesis lipoprotein